MLSSTSLIRPARRRAAGAVASAGVCAALGVSLLAGGPATAAVTITPVAASARAVTVPAAPVQTAPVVTPEPTRHERRIARVEHSLNKAQRKAHHQHKVRDRVTRVAKSRLGHSYVAAAAGPSAFDCSGLALWVWRSAAGRYLPHYSGAQADRTTNVKRANLRRGDLVFFMRGAHHVGVYIGHGRMVSATNPGGGVRIDSVFSGWYGSHYSGGGRLFHHDRIRKVQNLRATLHKMRHHH